MLSAELHIAGRDFPSARQALGDMAEPHPTARVLTLMAAIERGEGSLTFVIDHDLRQDARTACQIVLAYHRMLPDQIEVAPSRFTVITPQSL